MNDFVNEVDTYVSNFKQQKITEQQLYVSFAIAVMVMNKYNVLNEFNSMSGYYNQNYLNTIDVSSTEI
jgi:hypothetical protein